MNKFWKSLKKQASGSWIWVKEYRLHFYREIPLLSPENKTKLTNLYDKTYMITWIGATAIVSLQIYVFISNYYYQNFYFETGL